MAKRQRDQQIAVAFYYLVKSLYDENDPDHPIEEGFTRAEFGRVLARLQDTAPLDDQDDEIVRQIKAGTNMNFLYFD